MGTELHVVDMSPAIYAGSFNKRSFISGDVVQTVDGWREQAIPTGGISMLFNILSQYLPRGDFAFVADRQPTIKQEMYTGYKSSRAHKEDIAICKDVAEYILRDCGFTIYSKDGYEADDVIANIVRLHYDEYDSIFVHTGDSDLYILVDDKVSILPTSSRARTVTRENYEYTVSSKCNVSYNTLVFEKLLRGDPGKDIPAMSKFDQEFLRRRFYSSEFMRRKCGDWYWLLPFMERCYPAVYKRARLFLPLPIEDEEFPITHTENIQRIREWAYEIGNRRISGRKGELGTQIREMLDQSLYLNE